jgi:uncharacterized protein (DUF885 family)
MRTISTFEFRAALLVATCSLAYAASAAAASAHAPPKSLQARLDEQNALFEEQYASDLVRRPERATAVGDFRYNDRLNDYSLEFTRKQHDIDESFGKRLAAISTQGFAEQDALSHDLLLRALQQRGDDFALKEYEMPVNQMDGPHLRLADLPLSMPFDSVKHYEDYVSRLRQIPRVFMQTEEVLRAGAKDHLMPVRFLLEKIPAQCAGVIAADPYLLPLQKFPADFSEQDRQRLSQSITDAVNNDVLPAYREFSTFIANEYAPGGRSALSVESLPDGERRYLNDIRGRTTLSDMTPRQIHDLGLREIERIQADMLSIARGLGFADLAALRQSLKTDPRYIPTSSEQILDDFRHYIAQMQTKLPELFGYIPGSPVTVEAIPEFQAAAATHYQTGTPDGKRPGRVSVATADFAHRSLIDDEATAYHEGIPGHHMQLSVAQQMTSLPKFRQHSGNSGYSEGWALYAEQLGKEVGFYRDPVSDYGRLTSELFRAIRLVVDTGIHAEGWSRDQVVDFFRRYQAVDEPTIQSETDRYIAWPAQALAYKLGQLKFRELRARAQSELGARFDIRAFHDEMLNGGALPLDLLDARTNAWIRAQKSAAVTAPN